MNMEAVDLWVRLVSLVQSALLDDFLGFVKILVFGIEPMGKSAAQTGLCLPEISEN